MLLSPQKFLNIVRQLQREDTIMNKSQMPLCEKLRPTMLHALNLEPNVESMLQRMIENSSISNLLFYGKPGTGKTTTARIIMKAINADVYELNGSIIASDQSMIKQIENFATSASFIDLPKICFIDEADYLSMKVQASLRNLIERVSSNCRFIFTANNDNRLHAAIQSRFTRVNFDDMLFDYSSVIEKMTKHYETNLPMHGYKFDDEIVRKNLRNYYPDFRSVANQFEIELERI